MSTIYFRAMDTDWWLRIDGAHGSVAREAEQIVREAEAHFSRFRDDSALSRLNRERTLVDADLAVVIALALALRDDTDGAFDPTIGAAVLSAGYDCTFEAIGTRPAFAASATTVQPEVTIRGACVTLRGDGLMDLGGIVKGWTVDRIAAHAEHAGASAWLIDGGGDLRVGGNDLPAAGWPIGVPDGSVVHVRDRAVATSSTRRRRWATLDGEMHHIVTPDAGRAIEGPVTTATVIASDATTADVLATSLIADLDRALPALTVYDAAALIERADGTWWTTPAWTAYRC